MPRRLPILLSALLVSCSEPTDRPSALRLVDVFAEASVESSPPSGESSPTVWRFDDADSGWSAGAGVDGLTVREGFLVGTSTSDVPIVHVERTTGLDDPDTLHAVEAPTRFEGRQLLLVVLGGRGDRSRDRRPLGGPKLAVRKPSLAVG